MARRDDVPFDDWPEDGPVRLGNDGHGGHVRLQASKSSPSALIKERIDGAVRKSALRRVPDGALGAVAVVAAALVVACFVHWWPSSSDGGLSVTPASQTASSVVPASAAAGSDEAPAPSVQATSEQVTVDVAGAVTSPGVYTFAQGARVVTAIEAAGGVTQDAQPSAVNMARELQDGEQVYVPYQGEGQTGGAAATGSGATPAGSAASAGGAGAPGGLVNINSATAADLEALPGIGPATAQKIVSDRETNGPFASKEDLQRVSGIGEKKYAALADLICV